MSVFDDPRIDEEQRAMIFRISERARTDNYPTQAVFDIGYIIGILSKVLEETK